MTFRYLCRYRHEPCWGETQHSRARAQSPEHLGYCCARRYSTGDEIVGVLKPAGDGATVEPELSGLRARICAHGLVSSLVSSVDERAWQQVGPTADARAQQPPGFGPAPA